MEEIMDQEEELFGVVNRNAAGQKTSNALDPKAKAAQIRKENWHHLRCRIRGFWREVLEPAAGYFGLGAAMVAALVLELAPVFLTVPVALLCCMWVAVRVDRFFRG